MKIKFKEMAEYINYCSDSKITNYKTGEVKMIGASLDKGIFAYYNPKDKTAIHIFKDDDIVAVIYRDKKSYKALKEFIDFIEECKRDEEVGD